MVSSSPQADRVSWRALGTLLHGLLIVHVTPWIRLVRSDPTCRETHTDPDRHMSFIGDNLAETQEQNHPSKSLFYIYQCLPALQTCLFLFSVPYHVSHNSTLLSLSPSPRAISSSSPKPSPLHSHHPATSSYNSCSINKFIGMSSG